MKNYVDLADSGELITNVGLALCRAERENEEHYSDLPLANGKGLHAWALRNKNLMSLIDSTRFQCYPMRVQEHYGWPYLVLYDAVKKTAFLLLRKQNFNNVMADVNKKPLYYVFPYAAANRDMDTLPPMYQQLSMLADDEELKNYRFSKFEDLQRTLQIEIERFIVLAFESNGHGDIVEYCGYLLNSRFEIVEETSLLEYLPISWTEIQIENPITKLYDGEVEHNHVDAIDDETELEMKDVFRRDTGEEDTV